MGIVKYIFVYLFSEEKGKKMRNLEGKITQVQRAV